jgi:hypothetical protein
MKKSSTTTDTLDNLESIESLKAEIVRLQALNESEVAVEDFVPDIEIPLNTPIKVMNLFAGHLNLSKEEGGRGGTFKFTDYGQVKKINYSDLMKILEVHSNFVEAGYFVILDKRVIKNHGLESSYEKILTKDKIEQIVSGTEEGLALYSMANPKQQEIIIQLVVDKLVENPEGIDLNMVDKLSRISKIDISSRVKEVRGVLHPETVTDEE